MFVSSAVDQGNHAPRHPPLCLPQPQRNQHFCLPQAHPPRIPPRPRPHVNLSPMIPQITRLPHHRPKHRPRAPLRTFRPPDLRLVIPLRTTPHCLPHHTLPHPPLPQRHEPQPFPRQPQPQPDLQHRSQRPLLRPLCQRHQHPRLTLLLNCLLPTQLLCLQPPNQPRVPRQNFRRPVTQPSHRRQLPLQKCPLPYLRQPRMCPHLYRLRHQLRCRHRFRPHTCPRLRHRQTHQPLSVPQATRQHNRPPVIRSQCLQRFHQLRSHQQCLLPPEIRRDSPPTHPPHLPRH
jgi:hypothetical protein